jgi:hypothetical protein
MSNFERIILAFIATLCVIQFFYPVYPDDGLMVLALIPNWGFTTFLFARSMGRLTKSEISTTRSFAYTNGILVLFLICLILMDLNRASFKGSFYETGFNNMRVYTAYATIFGLAVLATTHILWTYTQLRRLMPFFLGFLLAIGGMLTIYFSFTWKIVERPVPKPIETSTKKVYRDIGNGVHVMETEKP